MPGHLQRGDKAVPNVTGRSKEQGCGVWRKNTSIGGTGDVMALAPVFLGLFLMHRQYFWNHSKKATTLKTRQKRGCQKARPRKGRSGAIGDRKGKEASFAGGQEGRWWREGPMGHHPVSCQNQSGQVNQLGLQMGMMPRDGGQDHTRLVGTCPGSCDSLTSPPQ